MSTCKTATPPPQARRVRKLKSWYNVFNNFPYETNWGFSETLPVSWENRLWRWTWAAKKGQNHYFRWKINNFFLRTARELNFSLKNSSLNVLTRNNYLRSGKNYYVEKNDLKFTKNWFFLCGFLTTCRKSHFPTKSIENTDNKVYIAKN